MKKTILLSFAALLQLQVWCQLNSKFTANTGNWYFANSYQARLAKDLGVSTAGQDGGVFNWRAIQADINIPSYNWTYTDSVVKALQSQGIDLFVTLRSVVPSNSINSNACSSGYAASGIKYSWYPIANDTVTWKQYVTAVVDRYDKNGVNDMPGLTLPINKWRTETEWQIYWCSPYPKDSIATAMQFVQFVNMTYNTIKTKQPSSIISFAGMDTRHDKVVFNDGYTGESSFCMSTNCTSTIPVITAQFNNPVSPVYLGKNKINMVYILKNAKYDELDIHEYGRWKYIPATVKWLRDSANVTKPIDFLEGGGPFCDLCEISATQAELTRWNSSYVVYYYLTGLANKINRLSWHISPEYLSFNASFGDMDLLDSTIVGGQYLKRPSYFTYRFLAKNIFTNIQADSVVSITEANPNLYHYEIEPMAIHAAWSTNTTDSIIVSGSGTLYTWDIPILASDTTIDQTTYTVTTNHTIMLTNKVPVFYSWSNPLGISQKEESVNVKVKIYPNPFSNSTTIEITDGIIKNYELTIFDLFGKEVKQYEISSSKTEISRDNLPSGMYFYQVKNKNQFISSGKLIIQ